MIIDFHTHIFPNEIADRAINNLQKSGNIKAAIGGTEKDLINEMELSKVLLSVVLPILTAPKHFNTMNTFAKNINEQNNGLISFGAINPFSENLSEDIKFLVGEGFKGVKLHPLFQNFDIDCIESEKLIEMLVKNGLIISIHAGYDVSFPNAKNATPDKLLKMIKDVSPQKVVLAHMGAASYWQESLEMLAETDVYFDTSFSLDEMDEDLFIKLINKKGENKVLFGTDSPWKSQQDYVKRFMKLNISQETKDKILYKNAKNLLEI